jgi:pimeloyl-ACP methyl ester carboxylesterase
VGFFQLRNLPEAAIRLNDYAFIRMMFRRDDPDHQWLSDADIERYVDALRRPTALTHALDYYRRLRLRYLGEISPGRVITRRTLVLWGESDPWLGTELLEGLDRWLRSVLILRYPAAGHWLNQQLSDEVNRALLAFLGNGGR